MTTTATNRDASQTDSSLNYPPGNVREDYNSLGLRHPHASNTIVLIESGNKMGEHGENGAQE